MSDMESSPAASLPSLSTPPLPACNEQVPPPPSVPADLPLPTPSPSPSPSPSPPHRFDPSRMIGIIKRKALIKDLAAVYHAECLAYCQELLELQRKCEEPYIDMKLGEDSRKQTMRPPKRLKRSR